MTDLNLTIGHAKMTRYLAVFLFFLSLCSCQSQEEAPVIELSWNIQKIEKFPKTINQAQSLPIVDKAFSQKINLNTKHKNQTIAQSKGLLGPKIWLWPIKGEIIHYFDTSLGRKGVDIKGKKGAKIKAAASGVVAYTGMGLKGYGNLIIIKHADLYLSAYANNTKNFVKEGQFVKAGEEIAEIGIVDRRYWGLHFEIRKAGRPVNPLVFLKAN